MAKAGETSRRDLALVVVSALAFSTAGPLGKVAASFPPIATASVRTGIASLVLALIARRELVQSFARLSGRQRARVVLAGALLGAHLVLFLAGLGATSLAAAVSLVSLEPLSVVLSAFFAFGIRPSPRELAGLLVATGGAAIVASGAGIGEHRLLGDAMVLGAVVLFGAYVASARGLRDALPATPYAAAVYGTASLVLMPLAVPLVVASARPDARTLGSVVALALVPTLIGHTLVQRAARHAPPVLVALVPAGETVGAMAIGAVLMGAMPTGREALGAGLILIGAALAIVKKRETGNRQQATGD